MWKNGEESMNFRNQNLNFNFVSQGIPFTPNMILPPHSNYVRQFFLEESRERKCVDNTDHSNVSSGATESPQGNMGNMLLRNCTTQHNLPFTPVNTNSQYGEHQFYNIGSSSQALQAKEECINNNSCGNFPPFHPEKSHFLYNQNFGSIETSQVELQLENTKDIGHKNNSKLCNPYLYPYPFKNIQSNVGSFELNLGRNEMVGGKKMDRDTTLETQIRIPNVDPPIKQTTEDNKGKETHAIFQYDGNTQTNCGSSNYNQILYGKTNHVQQTVQPTPQMSAHTDKVSNGVETKQPKQSEESNTNSMIKKSIEGNSISNENVLPDKPIEPAGKPSLLAEKLWDGTIQLSTFTTVSAVAFFKSGEKAQDMKWPEHLETKGKVRLQAFEKYIQELPRSRNRTLMLISICWKPGTSEAGLAGMKEIAKVFKEKERIGYAEISQGFDLYVCPRTETIITILAKHGFFKGMAVLENDQDSLIGCVIWRRSNNTPSNSVPKLVDKKLSPVSSVQESNSPESQEDELESKQKKADSAALQETSKELPKPIQEQKQEINGFRSARNFSFDPSSFTYVGAHAPIQVQPSVLVPPLPNQSNGDLTKVPSVVNKKLEPDLKLKNDDNDDDGDLPEFDFDYACGVKRSPTATTVSPLISHQKLVTEVKSVQKPIPIPIKRPIDIAEASDIKHGDPNSLANSNISKKSRWDNDDDDMPEWRPPEMENQSYSNDNQSKLANVNNKCVVEPPLKTIAPPSTMHPFQIQSQSNVIKPPLKKAREVPLMPPPPPPPPSQFGYVHGMRKPPANGFIVNDFRSPAAADFSNGNNNFDVSRQW